MAYAQQFFDEESVTFTVIGCEEEQPQQPPQQQQAAPVPITQETDQESEAGDFNQSFDIS